MKLSNKINNKNIIINKSKLRLISARSFLVNSVEGGQRKCKSHRGGGHQRIKAF